MKTVRIYGMARNLNQAPPPIPGVEVWVSNAVRGYEIRFGRKIDGEWTRYFNLHSREWMDHRYPSTVRYYKKWGSEELPIITQRFQPDIPGCKVFPRKEIQNYHATAKGPNRYFNCTVCWLIALAMMEGFERIELWGFALTDTKPGGRWMEERECFFYWVQKARDAGIEVTYQKEVAALPFKPGDPDAYKGPLYGYDTKPEVGWNSELQKFEDE